MRPRHCTQALLQIDSYSLLCRALCAESAAERPSPASAPPFVYARLHQPSETAASIPSLRISGFGIKAPKCAGIAPQRPRDDDGHQLFSLPFELGCWAGCTLKGTQNEQLTSRRNVPNANTYALCYQPSNTHMRVPLTQTQTWAIEVRRTVIRRRSSRILLKSSLPVRGIVLLLKTTTLVVGLAVLS